MGCNLISILILLCRIYFCHPQIERERERERDYAPNVEYLFLESTDRGTEFNNGYFVDKQFAAD